MKSRTKIQTEETLPELQIKYRPKTLAEVKGQPEAVRILEEMFRKKRVPHVLLLTGQPGVGKTTLARIVRDFLGCTNRIDYREYNCAAIESPMEMMQSIQKRMRISAAKAGGVRIWLLDEFQSLSRATFAQQSMLGAFEDTPQHVYFLLASSDPTKIIPAIRSRATIIPVKPLDDKTLKELVREVASKEGEELPDSLVNAIVADANGSARDALRTLNKILLIEDKSDRISAIISDTTRTNAFDLVKMLLWQKAKWQEIAKKIKELEGEDREKLRHLILTNAKNQLLKSNDKTGHRAYLIIQAFRDPWYDCKEAGLEAACWEVTAGG